MKLLSTRKLRSAQRAYRKASVAHQECRKLWLERTHAAGCRQREGMTHRELCECADMQSRIGRETGYGDAWLTLNEASRKLLAAARELVESIGQGACAQRVGLTTEEIDRVFSLGPYRTDTHAELIGLCLRM